jgi:DNA mismatch endonuclease (patch repair protein)
MSRIPSKDTLPELLIRKALWHMGYCYRLHYKKLPGKPDRYSHY